jgi:hypothetical protein
MSIQIPKPNITASDDRQRLRQIQSYLYKMAQQLQWAFDTLETGTAGSSAQIQTMTSNAGKKEKTDPAATFASLKNLIIKSADIVNAYYDTISSRLEGLYVAQSDFGTYVQETALEIEGNSEQISQLFVNNQTIIGKTEDLQSELDGLEGTVDELYVQAIETKAYIKSGLLAYDDNGAPIYGLEIGQTNSVDGVDDFDKFARFSADRLSFFDRNDVEVAYISDYKLYITNAEITGSLWLSGKFKLYYNGGLAFQWIGGDA